MDLKGLKDKLQKFGCSDDNVNFILDNVVANVNSFIYANEPLNSLDIYVVLKNTGGFRLFKTINGHIVVDKLDASYAESRELVCISNWNVKKILKVSFPNTKEAVVKDIDFKTMNKILFSLVEPISIKYVIGVEETNFPILLTVDVSQYKGLSYEDYKDVVLSSYKYNLEKHGESPMLVKEPSCYVVSYKLEY